MAKDLLVNVEGDEILVRGWVEEAKIKAVLNAYMGEPEDTEVKIKNIRHYWMRFIPVPGGDYDGYSGFYHIAEPNSKGATRLTCASFEY